MSDSLEALWAEILQRHRGRSVQSLSELRGIIADCEYLRESLSLSDSSAYERLALPTGRLISNICHDLIRHDDFQKLEINSPKDINGKKIFFLGHRGGLCNRLRAIAALQAGAEFFGFDFYFSWSETVDCRGGVLPVKNFANKIAPIMSVEVCKKGDFFIYDNPCSAWQIFELLRPSNRTISWDRFADLYRQKSSTLLQRLSVGLGLERDFEDFLTTRLPKKFTALHIRRTDFVEYFASRFPDEVLPSVESYRDFVSRELGDEPFFLSTDDESVRDFFMESFGSRVCFVERPFDPRQFRQTGFEHSVLDLGILSRCERFVPTPRSSFSDYAKSISRASIVAL